MTNHDLKIDPAPLDALLSGAKTGEVRRDDRGFTVGDTVHLTCADGREAERRITHIQRGYGLPEGICVLSYAHQVGAEDACPSCGGTGHYGDAARRAIDGPDGDLVSRELRPLESDELTMLDKHTQIGPCGQPRLVIDQQSFDLDNDGAKWKPERAQWYRRQMAIALARLLRKARALPTAGQDRAEPVAWAEVYSGKAVTVTVERNKHHQVPLYLAVPHNWEVDQNVDLHRRAFDYERSYRQTKAECDRLAEQCMAACRNLDKVAAEAACLRDKVQALTDERDALRAQVEAMKGAAALLAQRASSLVFCHHNGNGLEGWHNTVDSLVRAVTAVHVEIERIDRAALPLPNADKGE
ncbi:DUF3850 domain-containing protein [Paenirhodobacter populi]|uniref:DUF3850 domain-containing protein n=1 Tax=Paenirhodobacter populi TaxID=2306993 RepID=UPI000FE2D1F6|nr:DUF3850 domain-containing protein [Sinirhodobacter populi]RWR09769.1 DUF3850 domain-containing protein [Sinirhodobacter populi]